MKQLFDIITWEPNVKMQYELLLMLLLFLLPAAYAKTRGGLLRVWGLAAAFFLFLHRALLPFLVSGAYFFLLCGLLGMLYRLSPSGFFLSFSWARRAFLACLGISDGEERKRGDDGGKTEGDSRRGRIKKGGRNSRDDGNGRSTLIGPIGERGVLFLAAVILTVLLCQLCRINIAVDYDSLRYGLRSPYVLLGGGGIAGFFENPGLVNTVYTYSKGFELLTLPLSFLPSYAFVLCFNVWVLIAVLLLTGSLAKKLCGMPQAGAAAAFFAALMPGITNMAVTAKSDLLTLLCQLCFLYAVVQELDGGETRERKTASGFQKERSAPVGLGLAALFASYALKPTAMLFSSAAGLLALCFLLFVKRRLRLPDTGSVRVLILSLLFTGLCWLRTFLITGLPVTSVFSGIFTRLGFSLRYPFGVQSVPDGTQAEGFLDGLSLFFGRLLRFLFCPLGTDMEHVRMAWGGAAFTCLLLFLMIAAVGILRRLADAAQKNGVRRAEALTEADIQEKHLLRFRFLLLEFCAVLLLSLLSLRLLYQVDGNYYMLLYALTAALGGAGLCLRLSDGKKAALLNGTALSLLAACMLYVTAFTGWAGAVGFTPLPLRHTKSGIEVENILYYDHKKEERKQKEAGNYAKLWEELETSEKGAGNHVIAFAEEPDCYGIRCVTESYTDIAGSGGNVYLVKTLNLFKEYLSWAGVDYIYADQEWLARSGNERAQELLEDLIEDGTLTDLVYESERREPDAAADIGAKTAADMKMDAGTEAADAKTDTEAETATGKPGRCFYGRIDAFRVKEHWEVPLSEEASEKARAQLRKYQLSESGFAEYGGPED